MDFLEGGRRPLTNSTEGFSLSLFILSSPSFLVDFIFFVSSKHFDDDEGWTGCGHRHAIVRNRLCDVRTFSKSNSIHQSLRDVLDVV